uniref:anti-sigma factor n=1 Tax=Bradyrhizobium sp. (strain ORS 278) TaxID=114615 RepID=UPI0002FB0A49|nr:anti-sigma factor [Bradyrhizobium sp. ORS 278]
MAYSEDHIALAAEYALGTLDAVERAQVETMMTADQGFAALVQTWEFRLGSLNQMVGLVEPRPELWQRIKAEIARSEPAVAAEAAAVQAVPAAVSPVVVSPPERPAPDVVPVGPKAEPPKLETLVAEVPEVEPPKMESPKIEPTKTEPSIVDLKGPEAPPIEIARSRAASGAPPLRAPRRNMSGAREGANDNANVVRLSSRVRQWRAVANVMTAVAAALLALVGVQLYRPDLLPLRLQPKPLIQTAQVKVPATPEPAAQFVALLQKDAASPAFILTVDSATRSYTVRRVGAAPEPGKSFELWIVSDKLQKPRSLGVIGGSDFTSRPVLSSYDPDVVSRATYAVTVEPEGGSPTGQATGPIVFTGKLIETVPPGK